MKRYIISFQSAEEVQDFLKSINPNKVEFSLKNNIVICECSDAEIELAKNGYGADVDELTKAILG